MPDTLTKDSFLPRLDQTFRIALSSGESLDLTLMQVRDVTAGGLGAVDRTPFALLFRGGPRDRYLPQQTYDLVHPELGTLSIFIVPVGPDERGMCYEAIFT